MPSGAVYLNEATGISFSLDQRTVTFVGGIKELGAGENWAQLWVLDHLYDRWPDAVLNFRGNTTNSGERVLLTENGAFSIVKRYDWGDEIGFNWVVSNSNGRLTWTTLRMPDWNGNEAAGRGHFWICDEQTYAWKGGAGLWNDPAMWEPEGTKTYDQAGYPVTGSYFTFPAGVASEVTIPATDKPLPRPVAYDVLEGATVTLKAAEGAQAFGFWRTDVPLIRRKSYVREGASFIVSGVKGRWCGTDNDTALDIAGKNAYVEFTDGADIDLGWNNGNWAITDWSDNRVGRGIRFTKGAKVRLRGSFGMAGPNEYVIDDAQVTMAPDGNRDNCRVEFALRDGGRFVFRGKHPLLQANNRISAKTDSNPAGAAVQYIDFEIPADGFVEAPLRSREGTTYKLGVTGGASREMHFRVPTNSPVAMAKGILDQPLIYWPVGKETWMVTSDYDLPHPDTDYWFDTFDSVSGAFTGWGVHIVGRPDVEEPQVVGLAVTNVVAGAADLFFYGIPGTNAASATFSATLERVDLPSDTSAALVLTGGTAGSVAQGTRFTIAATGLVEGGVYRVTVTGVDDGDSSLTCTETVVFNALADYAEASTSSTGATATQDGPYTVWTFTDTESEGVFTVTRAGTARILVVGGGGGGGGGDSTATNEGDTRRGGGGGGGGEVVETELYLQPGDYFVTVGAGGASVGSFTVGLPGGYSTFAGLVTAYGGGGGGARSKRNNSDGQYVDPGANGGGAAGQGAVGGAATAVGGHAGGVSTYNGWAKWTDVYAGAGGGSMGGVGGDAGLDALNMLAPGNGADGVPSDITGSVVYYGGGGGGGGASYAFGPGIGGLGGKGGGGEGRSRRTCTTFALESSQGADGFGGGGGGGSSGGTDSNCPSELQAYRSGRGGSGAVIVRMRTATARTADPQIVLRSAEPTAGGLDLTVGVHSLGNGESSADLLFVATADGAGAATTNALGTVAATGDASTPAPLSRRTPRAASRPSPFRSARRATTTATPTAASSRARGCRRTGSRTIPRSSATTSCVPRTERPSAAPRTVAKTTSGAPPETTRTAGRTT